MTSSSVGGCARKTSTSFRQLHRLAKAKVLSNVYIKKRLGRMFSMVQSECRLCGYFDYLKAFFGPDAFYEGIRCFVAEKNNALIQNFRGADFNPPIVVALLHRLVAQGDRPQDTAEIGLHKHAEPGLQVAE